MKVLQKQIKLTQEDSCSHMNIPFKVPSDGEFLYVKFSYFPKYLEDKESSFKQLLTNLEHYAPNKTFSEKDLEEFLPIKNLLTVSLDSPFGFVGTAHRHTIKQNHTISERKSSNGFLRQKIIKGEWNITISAHLIVTPYVNIDLEVSYE